MTDRTKGIVLICAALLWWRVKHNLNNISANIEGISYKGISGSNAVFQISMIVRNPTLVDIDIQEIAGSLYLFGTYLANVSTGVEQTVKRNSYTRVNADLVVDMTKIGDVLKGSVQSGKDTIQGTFDGYLVIEGIKIPVNEDFETQA